MIGIIALAIIAVAGLMALVLFPEVFQRIRQSLTVTLFVLLVLTVFSLLLIAITDFDPDPMIRHSAVMMTHNRLVDFFSLLPKPQYRVERVLRLDTDGDEEKEWVVFYQFDLADGRSPYAGAIYDDDRGDPPILFPYKLIPPDRNYLSEGEITIETEAVVDVLEDGTNQPEILISGWRDGLVRDLTIFRYRVNSLPSDPPTNNPPRYLVIGNFRGDGGVSYDPKSKKVMVVNLAHDRSQLAIKSVYEMDPIRQTYMGLENAAVLSNPISETVTFAFGMPEDIVSTPYPEKKVLAFYELLGADKLKGDASEYLTGEALVRYNQKDWEYFGFSGTQGDIEGKVYDLRVSQLDYSPDVECADRDIQCDGEPAQYSIARIAFAAWVDGKFVSTETPVEWVTRNITNSSVSGIWKMDHRIYR